MKHKVSKAMVKEVGKFGQALKNTLFQQGHGRYKDCSVQDVQLSLRFVDDFTKYSKKGYITQNELNRFYWKLMNDPDKTFPPNKICDWIEKTGIHDQE